MWVKLGIAIGIVWWLTRSPASAAGVPFGPPEPPHGNVDEGDGFSVYVPGGGDAFDPSSVNARQPGTP